MVNQEQELSSQFYSLTKDRNITHINQMYETIHIYKILSTDNYSPLDNLTAINKLKPQGSKINGFSWNFNKDTKKITIKLLLQFTQNNTFLYEYQKLENNAHKIFNNYIVKISKPSNDIMQRKDPITVEIELER